MNIGIRKHLEKLDNKDDKILLINLLDRYDRFCSSGVFISSNFINEREELLVRKYLPMLEIYKVNELCSKSVVSFSKDDIDILRITPVSGITHRDVLGSLFSLGLENDMIGDIFVEDDCIYLTSLKRLSNFITQNLLVIRNVLVKIEVVDDIIFTKNHLEKRNLIVSSTRLDTIVGSLANTSRSEAVDKICQKQVLVNYQEVNKVKEVKKDDIISIRGVGKFKMGDTIMITKKNKKVVEVYKYV